MIWVAANATVASAAATGEGLRWGNDIDAAKRHAAATNRLVLVHFGAPSCGPCQLLERHVFSQPGFGSELNANFVAVKVNTDAAPHVARQYGVERIPADVILASDGRVIQKFTSPNQANQYVAAMNQVAASVRPVTNQFAAQQAAATAVAAATQSRPALPADDRYADYFNRVAQQEPAPYTPPQAMAPQASAPYAAPTQPAAPQVATQQPFAPSANAMASAAPYMPPVEQSYTQQPPAPTVAPQVATSPAPAGNSNYGLEGFCPVTLCTEKVWRQGDARWGANHRGQIYLFASEEAQKAFLANPDHYSPVLGGNDPVIALDQGVAAPGFRKHGVFYEGRVFLFSHEESLDRFASNPDRYSAQFIRR